MRSQADSGNFVHSKFDSCSNVILLWHLYPISSFYDYSHYSFGILLTFLVPKEQGLLCRVWPLEGSVIIVIHTAGHVGCAPLHHRHILSYGELTLASCGITRQSLRSWPWQIAALDWFLMFFHWITLMYHSGLTPFKVNGPSLYRPIAWISSLRHRKRKKP